MSGSATDRFRRADAIFDAALDLGDAEQTAYVVRACGDDAALRAEVLGLLRASRSDGGLLDGAAAPAAALLANGAPPAHAPLAGATPARVGPFRVVREIGRGGMGRVFLAERADGQFEQRVALKLLQHASPGLVRRFLDERRILARLEHPGIARLLDGGVAADGLPYFALEYVEGEHVDQYCAARDLPLDARLALVEAVCDAVSYAHEHLVIHRDLKPSNVLVTAAGQVKLLDFGIAKLLGDDAADDTRPELRAMTPEFAAPEQVRGAPVSAATDVYALGVLLYLLVAGERPYELRGRSPAEVERIVCESEPPPPSARAPAARRRRLRGDLDLIVMTALRKAEARRYRTPAALAEDLRRFRAGRPIVARPDSAAYRARRFAGRHRAGIAAGAALVLALAGAASRERTLRLRAEVALRKATEVERFLVGVFDVADPYAPRPADGGRVTADELLDRSARRIDSTLAGQPDVQAELRAALGRVYANLGLYDRATPLLRRSLEQRTSLRDADGPAVAAHLDLLGAALTEQDRYDEAEPLLRRALDLRRRSLGGRDTATAASLARLATLLEKRNRYQEAIPLHREALAIYRSALGDTAVRVASLMGTLGLVLYGQGAYDEGESLQRRALDIARLRLGEGHPLTAEAMRNLSLTLQLRRDFAGAERLLRQSVAANRRALGDAHPSVAAGLNELAQFLTANEPRLDEAEALAREAIALDRRTFGGRHSSVADGLRNLGVVLRTKGDFAGSERALREALAVNRALLGEPHRKVAIALGHLAQTVYQTGDAGEAVGLMRESLAQNRALLGDRHVSTLLTAEHLGRMLAASGDASEAERLLRLTLAAMDTSKREHRMGTLPTRRALGEAVLAQGRAREALPILAVALEETRARHGAEHWRTAEAQLSYGRALAAVGRDAEARPLLLAAQATLARARRTQPRLAASADAAAARLPAR
jgi:serine/threonine-protein kinase